MNIELAILKALYLSDPLLVAETTLLATVRLTMPKAPMRSEFDLTVRHLEDISQIIGVDNPDIGRRYRLADLGKARLAAAGV